MTFAALTLIFFPLEVICERKENLNKAQSNQQNKTKRLLKELYAKPKITLSRLSVLCSISALPSNTKNGLTYELISCIFLLPRDLLINPITLPVSARAFLLNIHKLFSPYKLSVFESFTKLNYKKMTVNHF